MSTCVCQLLCGCWASAGRHRMVQENGKKGARVGNMFAPHTPKIACACVTAVTWRRRQRVFAQAVMILPDTGNRTHTQHAQNSPPLGPYLLGSVMATGSVLECACSGNMCQGTDEPTRGTFGRFCSHLSAEEWFHKHRARCFLTACLSRSSEHLNASLTSPRISRFYPSGDQSERVYCTVDGTRRQDESTSCFYLCAMWLLQRVVCKICVPLQILSS